MGDKFDEFIGILEGCAELEWGGIGQQSYHVQLLWPGDWFGEYALITGKPRRMSATARTAVELAIVPAHRLYALLEEAPIGWRSIADLSNEHMARATDSLINRLHPGRDAKCAAVLLNLAHSDGVNPRKGALSIPITQYNLAHLTNMSRTSVGAALKKLSDLRLIDVRYSSINIPSIERLIKHVEHVIN